MTKSIHNRKRMIIVLTSILTVAVVVLSLLWNRYLNRNSLLDKFETVRNQEVYLLGTFHETHFNKWINYSMEDVLSVVENVQPNVVFIEAREEYFSDYGVVDGPIDMAVVYSYCKDNNIQVKMIDWWVVDNQYQAGTTSNKRDDMIFKNIDKQLDELQESKKVLVVCGAGHFYEQTSRFLDAGFNNQKIENKSTYFNNNRRTFKYPISAESVWEQRAYFYAYTYPNIIEQDDTLRAEIKAEFTNGNHDAFYEQQIKYCNLFSNNQLYE